MSIMPNDGFFNGGRGDQSLKKDASASISLLFTIYLFADGFNNVTIVALVFGQYVVISKQETSNIVRK